MKRRTSYNRNGGFTLVEVLAAVAVLVILLAVSAVAVVQYRDNLKITELDNAAREIYMAAQNRATLLAGSRQLSSLVGQSGTGTVSGVDGQATGSYISCADVKKPDSAYADLLPTGSIDATLLGGDFYIVYEPESGSVTDVFYAESTIGVTKDGFQSFYSEWKDKSKDVRMKHDPMLGYYGGGKADVDGTTGTDRLHTPGGTVLIHNEEELWVEVTFLIPDGATASEKKVELIYDNTTINLIASTYNSRLRETVGQNSTTYAWTLDSLNLDKNKQPLRFSGLVNPSGGLGKDFTVTASITVTADGKRPAEASAYDSDNSLFAEVSTEGTAKLKYLRHLQNLDANFSKVSGIAKAEQQADIQCLGNETYGDFKGFKPISNAALRSYNGQQKEIRGLYVDVSGDAGLFADAESAMHFTGIRLVNTYVKGMGAAGALVGKAGNNTVFDDCYVYWEPTDTSSYTDLLGSNAEGDAYKYQINGATAGGLAGSVGAGSTIQNSLAATLINGSDTAGGLVGSAGGDLTVSTSYADCYLTGKASAGLVGGGSGTVELTDCYAAGYIDMSGSAIAAGLCVGQNVTVTAEHVYSVVRPVGLPAGATNRFWYLARGTGSTYTNTHCLDLGIEGQTLENGIVRPYDEMTNRETKDDKQNFVATLGGTFAWKSSADSHPYNLREDLQLTNYDFPGLKGLPHYGDWTAQFKEPSLVYYEKYSDNTYGFSGGNARTLVKSLSDKKTITLDGYAVALLGSDLDTEKNQVESIEITYSYFDTATQSVIQGKKQTVQRTEWLKATGKTDGDTVEKTYYLIPLPDTIPTDASPDFYQYLGFTLTYTVKKQTVTAIGTYFYNPHFSETVNPVPAQDVPSGGWTTENISSYAKQLIARNYRQADLRTPRHLYELSRNSEYYHGGYSFQQRLDLDYSTYTEYKDENSQSLSDTKTFRQAPIGTESAPFLGTYNGGSHTISSVLFNPANLGCVGLFGRSQGSLSNIIYHMKLESALTVARTWNRLYLGALVGWNEGTVSNCAASGLKLNAVSSYAPFYIGGLVGYSTGTVQNCGVEAPQLALNGIYFGTSYVGGLLGWNEGWVTTSYAVAKIDGTVDQNSNIWSGGFVGRNSGTVTNSYAAAHMVSSGLNTKASGFCGKSEAAGTQANTYYLNMGNLTYQETPYAAVYSDTGAAGGRTYEELLTDTYLPGMEKVSSGSYPYPSAVRDAAGQPVYPGDDWPKPLDLGVMGIYYWERLDINGVVSYNTSLLTVNPNPEDRTIIKRNALSTAHDDGGIVTDYGYGYYAADAGNDARVLTVKAQDINYYSTVDKKGYIFKQDQAQTEAEKAVDAELASLMPGFTFHSYRSLDLDKQAGGLYPAASTTQPNGTLTLEQTSDTKTVSVTFTLNPFFADAMSVTLPEGWDSEKSTAPTAAPGSAAGNPYSVRAIGQLEFINWNSQTMNTTTVLTSSNYGQFPYLSSQNMTKTYYWTQSHDIMGETVKDKDGNDVYKTYTPIAEYYDSTNGDQGNLEGWFGGVYDGKDYVIENVNIQGQKSSCAGLFGVVYNGKLSNIILYSSDGAGKISTTVNQTRPEQASSAWYAMGALAGVVGSNQENSVDNCSVAGYTIDATVYTGGGWGGNNIGGLIGSTDLNLSNCTAVTTIYVHEATENDNMRVGGLVGSCHGTISNCYAGGEIKFDETIKQETAKARYIYVGGLVAGSYMKPLKVSGSTDFIGVNPRDGDAKKIQTTL